MKALVRSFFTKKSRETIKTRKIPSNLIETTSNASIASGRISLVLLTLCSRKTADLYIKIKLIRIFNVCSILVINSDGKGGMNIANEHKIKKVKELTLEYIRK